MAECSDDSFFCHKGVWAFEEARLRGAQVRSQVDDEGTTAEGISLSDREELHVRGDSLCLRSYRSEPSSYARQLNLPQSCDRAGRQVKRKRSVSPAPSSSSTPTHR